jgi:hypothetical protein
MTLTKAEIGALLKKYFRVFILLLALLTTPFALFALWWRLGKKQDSEG